MSAIPDIKGFLGTEIRVDVTRRATTMSAVAAATGMTRQTLSTKVNGHTDFTITELRLVASALGTTAPDLVARAEAAAAASSSAPAPAHSASALAGPTPTVPTYPLSRPPLYFPPGARASLAAATTDEVGPSEADLEAHVAACDSCTCDEDALEHARQAAEEVA